MKISGSLLYPALFLFLFLLGGSSLLAQSRAELLFQKAYDNRFDDSTAQLRSIYEEIVANHGRSGIYPMALSHLADILLDEGEQERAMALFRELVEKDFSDLGETGEEKVGKEEMKERYTNIQHSAARELARWHIEARRFQKALEYIALADTVHIYRHFCGNTGAGRRVFMAMMYADCYEGMGDMDKAIEVLQPYAEYDSYLNMDARKRYFRLMSTRYTREEQRRIAEEAVERIRIERREADAWNMSAWQAKGYTDLFGIEIYLASSRDEEAARTGRIHSAMSDEEWLEYYREVFRNNEYYKFLHNGEH